MTDTQDVQEDLETFNVPNSWEFLETPPTLDMVKKKLETLPHLWGVSPADFAEYVQPLSQTKNMSLEKNVKDYKTVWTLYFTVAGRLAMLNAAIASNEWRVEFEPEPTTPTGIPGYLMNGLGDDDRIVYREYVVIKEYDEKTKQWMQIGRRPGTAWVPAMGGSNAVASNRYEKVETSARGRALGAWGFGVLPGSGVASLEEMVTANQLQEKPSARGGRQTKSSEARPRLAIEEELNAALAEYAALLDLSSEEVDAKVLNYTTRSFGKEVHRKENGPMIWNPLKDGELVLTLNNMKSGVARARAEKQEL